MKLLEILYENGAVDATLNKTLANLIEWRNKNHCRLNDDTDSHKWNVFLMSGEKAKYMEKV